MRNVHREMIVMHNSPHELFLWWLFRKHLTLVLSNASDFCPFVRLGHRSTSVFGTLVNAVALDISPVGPWKLVECSYLDTESYGLSKPNATCVGCFVRDISWTCRRCKLVLNQYPIPNKFPVLFVVAAFALHWVLLFKDAFDERTRVACGNCRYVQCRCNRFAKFYFLCFKQVQHC